MSRPNGTSSIWFKDTDGRYVRIGIRPNSQTWTLVKLRAAMAKDIAACRARGGTWDAVADKLAAGTLRAWMLNPVGPARMADQCTFTDAQGRALPST